MAGIPNLIAVVTDEDTCVAINPETIARVAPRTMGGATLQFEDGSFLAIQGDFEELTGIDPEAEIEKAKEAKEEKAQEKAAEEAKAKAAAEKEAASDK